MLERFHINDFQCHEELDIQFDERITTIIGPSDVGKSSIIRALRWMVTNRPLGDSFIRQGTKKTSVKLKMDGETIRRRRGGGENVYEVGDKRFEAFGNGVPSEVLKVLNLSETNFQLQHQMPFWFDKTPGELAKELNKIVDLDVIDETMDRVALRLRKAVAEREVVEDRLAESKRGLTELTYVPMLDEQLCVVEEKKVKKEKIGTTMGVLLDLVGKAVKCRSDLDRSRRLLVIGTKAAKKADEAVGLGNKVKRLLVLLDMIIKDQAKMSRQIPSMDMLIGKKEEWERLGKACEVLLGMTNQIKAQERGDKRGEAELVEARRLLATESGGRCPVCGGLLKL